MQISGGLFGDKALAPTRWGRYWQKSAVIWTPYSTVYNSNFRAIIIIFFIHVLHIFVSYSSPEWSSNSR